MTSTNPRRILQMEISCLTDGSASFNVSLYNSNNTVSTVVLFAVGAGGLPERYATLLHTLVASGCMVVAPHFERLTSAMPSEDELALRARRLSLTLDALVAPGIAVVGVGHSIGAATLFALLGAQMWLGPGKHVGITPDSRLTRLVMLAAPTRFFQAPCALDVATPVPILAWVGSVDNITPASQTAWLVDALSGWPSVELCITDGAGHFSFMDLIPPQSKEPLPDKQAFLEDYSQHVCKFVLGC